MVEQPSKKLQLGGNLKVPDLPPITRGSERGLIGTQVSTFHREGPIWSVLPNQIILPMTARNRIAKNFNNHIRR